MQHSDIDDVRLAMNIYRTALAAAEGFNQRQAHISLHKAEKRLRDLLWEHKDSLVELVRAFRERSAHEDSPKTD